LKKLHRQLFEGIDWSTERVLEQTIQRAREIDLPVHLLLTWYDVDDRETLKRLCQEFFGANGSAGAGNPAPATRQFLDEMLQSEGRQRIWPNESPS
jgi:hypothetical protein